MWCLKIFPKMQLNIARISALAPKMGQIKKIKAFYYIKGYIITNLHECAFIFLIGPILVARAEILAIISLHF